MAQSKPDESKQNDETKSTSYEMVETTSIVIDNGTYHIKAGHGGDALPRIVEPNVAGRSKDKDNKTVLYGRGADMTPGLTLSYPMKYSLVMDFEEQECIWHYILNKKLKIKPSEQDILITEPPLNPAKNREKTAQIFFEKFNVAKFYIGIGNVLSLYASGRKNGITLDAAHSLSHFVPIIDGYAVPKAIRRIDMGGDKMNDYLHELLKEKGYSFKSKKTVERIKESLCYISTDYENELSGYKKEKKYELPDGKIINIGIERFKCSECLFNPSLAKSEAKGIITSLKESIDVFDDKNKQKIMYNNIVLAGGCTLLNGFKERVENDITRMVDANVKIISINDRRYSAFIGGSILVSLSTFQSMYITKEEWDDQGPSVVAKKCK